MALSGSGLGESVLLISPRGLDRVHLQIRKPFNAPTISGALLSLLRSLVNVYESRIELLFALLSAVLFDELSNAKWKEISIAMEFNKTVRQK